MKFTKSLAAIAAASLAVSSLAVSAFAAEPKVEAIKLDPNGTKLVQWNAGVLGDAEITSVEVTGTASLGDGWVGGGGSFGFDAIFADGSEDWTQVDFALDGAMTVLDAATGEFTATLEFPAGTKANLAKATSIAQLGWWWGSGDSTCDFSDIKVNGESIIGAYAPVATVEKTQDSDSKVKADVTLGAQFDSTGDVIAEWPTLPSATIKADGSDVTLKYDFSQFGAPVKFGGNYVALNTTLAWEDYDNNLDLYNAENVKIKSIKFDGVEYGDYSKLAVNNEGGDALRITLMNEWNDNYKNGNAPLSGVTLPEFTTFEITFSVAAPADDADEPDVTPGESSGEVPEEPVEPGESEDPVEPVNPGESSGKPVNPDSGVAVAVVPAALAAAAVATAGIVLKKRSK